MYVVFERDIRTTDDPLLLGDRKPNHPFCRLSEFAPMVGGGEGGVWVNLLGFLSTETVQYVSVNRWITESRGSSLRRVISETAPSVLPNAPLEHPSWVTSMLSPSLFSYPTYLTGRDLMDESNNPLLPGFSLGQRVAVIACNYKFIKLIVQYNTRIENTCCPERKL